MSVDVQFITNNEGAKTAAVIPIEDWNRIMDVLDEYESIEASLKRGFAEVRAMEKGEAPMRTLEAYLDGLEG